jgi:uncharacterized protein YceH (UPF0502 family)
VEPDAVEIRVLGCLIEKQRTTPDAYPLTLNALRLACNQSTNRDPVVDYDESTMRAALDRLGRRKWTTLASWSNRRAMKYRHTLDSALGLSDPEMALLCVLMLRGPQTPGELKQRSERLHPFAGLDEVEDTVRGLIERDLVAGLPRRPGQREGRYAQLLGGAAAEDGEVEAGGPPRAGAGAAEPAMRHAADMPAAAVAADPAPAASPGRPTPAAVPPTSAPAPAAAGLERRVARLEEELASLARLEEELASVARLEEELASLRADLRNLREELGA